VVYETRIEQFDLKTAPVLYGKSGQN